MKHNYFILAIMLLSFGCNKSNQTEKDYIKNLEEKNKILEKEISDLKNNSGNISLDKSNREIGKNEFFSIGSSEKKVLEIMGNPTSYINAGTHGKMMMFGLSSVTFENGKVTSYSNIDENLKVQVKE